MPHETSHVRRGEFEAHRNIPEVKVTPTATAKMREAGDEHRWVETREEECQTIEGENQAIAGDLRRKIRIRVKNEQEGILPGRDRDLQQSTTSAIRGTGREQDHRDRGEKKKETAPWIGIVRGGILMLILVGTDQQMWTDIDDMEMISELPSFLHATGTNGNPSSARHYLFLRTSCFRKIQKPRNRKQLTTDRALINLLQKGSPSFVLVSSE